MRSPIYNLTAITILWIITVISTRVCCSGSNIQLYSACPAKHVHVYQNGSVLADDDSSTPQILTISTDKMLSSHDSRFLVTLYAQDVGMFLCFNKRWKLIGLKRKRACARCHFIETMHHGYFRYISADDDTKYIGFRKIGRPLRYNRILKQDESCFNFFKRPANVNSKTPTKTPSLCSHYKPLPINNTINYNNYKLSNSSFTVNNKSSKNVTVGNKMKQKRRRNESNKFRLTNDRNSTLLYTDNFRAHHVLSSNLTNESSDKLFNHHKKNQKILVSKNTEKNNLYSSANRVFGIIQPRHRQRHSHSRHNQHEKRISNRKILETEIKP